MQLDLSIESSSKLLPFMAADGLKLSWQETPAVELIGVSKKYAGHYALRSLDFSASVGETVALQGGSGCGKSTLLRIVLGLVSPDTGVVRIHGKMLTESNVDGLRKRMGYVVQDGGLSPHLSALDNILLMPRHLGKEGEAIRYLAELCDLMRIPVICLDRRPGLLAGSQLQRASLIRALITRPDLLILDEPIGALEPRLRAELQMDLKRIIKRQKLTVLMATHDPIEASVLADRVVTLRSGMVVGCDRSRDLPQAASYGGSGFGFPAFTPAQRKAVFH